MDINKINKIRLAIIDCTSSYQIKHTLQSYNMDKQQEKDIARLKENKKRNQNKKEDEQEGIGPSLRKMQKLQYHELLLDGLPTSDLYEISYMHKETINNVVASPKADYIITVSIDGHIKFWKKVFQLVEFAKNFKAHSGLITGVALSKNHDLFCSVGLDKTLKIFDVFNCDLRLSIRLNFVPSACEFIPQEGRDWELIAISEEKTGKIWIVDPEFSHGKEKVDQDEEVVGSHGANNNHGEQTQKKEESTQIVNQISFHKHPIKFIKMNWALNFCISIDQRGFLQIWDPKTFDFPKHMPYECKIQTDFLQLLQANSLPLSLSLSPLGTYLAVILKDKIIRIFNLKTGKLVHTISQNIKEIIKIQQDTNHPLHINFALEQAEYDKKLNLQKDLEITKEFLFNPNVEFDQSEEFIIYTSFHGIKLYSLSNKCVERTIGRKENQRFIRVSLYQGKQMRNPSGNANLQGERKAADPIIIATSFRRPRFYLFSRRVPQIEPENAMLRDIINERQTRQENATVLQPKITEKQNEVIFQTTMGDIHLLLNLEDCPKTCENFIKLVKKGYYNGMIFHRVIKGFMIQSGCPKGDGTGGESVWGGMFQDELRPEKYRFDRPYVLAMANRGPNTNGSQFFITVIACPWLDNKHTIFGRVVKGIEAVCDINKQKTDKGEKPLVNIKIMSAKVV